MTTIKAISEKKTYALEFDGKHPEKGSIDGKLFDLDLHKEKEGSYHLILEGKSYIVELIDINREEKKVALKVNNQNYSFTLQDRYDDLLTQLGMSGIDTAKVTDLKAPMPGLVLNIAVDGGSEVKKGDPLLILEAMKMENVLKSPTDGTIKEIAVKQGDAVEKNQLLLNFQ